MTSHLLEVLLFLGLVDLWALVQLRRRTFFARFVEVRSLQEVEGSSIPVLAAYRERIAAEPWFEAESARERCLGALRWTCGRATRYNSNPHVDPVAILESLETGAGAICGHMAVVAAHAMVAAGVPARIVNLSRELFDTGDSHVTVEALLEGRWVVMDPTFHVSFTDRVGRLLSAQEVKERFLRGRRDDLIVKSHGEVAYPVRHDRYYLDVLVFFNNVFVLGTDTAHPLAKLPPFRYWLGPQCHYERIFGESVDHLDFWKRFYFLAVVALPSSLILVSLGLVGLLLGGWA